MVGSELFSELWPRRRQAVVMVAAVLLNGCASARTDSWHAVFDSTTSQNWSDDWFVEGERAVVEPVPGGFVFSAGDELNDPASHAVLWSKASYSGDIKVEYDYTRLDTMTDVTSVNILYLLATGLGEPDTPSNIFLSRSHRRVSWMKAYFLGMNLLHISYAATGPDRSHYVSARRYPARSKRSFDQDTQIQPVYENVDLFKPGSAYHITATKQASTLSLMVEDGDTGTEFSWDTSTFAPVTHGRVGLRHMWGRSSRYQNFKIFVKDPTP